MEIKESKLYDTTEVLETSTMVIKETKEDTLSEVSDKLTDDAIAEWMDEFDILNISYP
ncbi:hypothetical protein [Sphingobacterium rhinopitheci]|uniref:hypothetical protein n=1 Tax=Sphingobacterium rhinopitheci TaxID=2781960 RepID=UPI001F517DA4|nr:hypothetical protein [Sphingobacterium rhinopitheci]MCI0922632.1 hypothetical protein [Sphingobacterium rhinopitheci]